MGTNINFYGSPAENLYAPARLEVDYDDEMLTNFQRIAEHDHGDGGGKSLAFGSPVAIDIANADGVGVLPARHDHIHSHGSIAGAASAIHPDLADVVHGHGTQYADAGHTHSVDSSALWERITDAVNGDSDRSLVADPAANETTVRVRQVATGALEVIQGAIGAGAATEGVHGPMVHLIQRNPDPDATAPDHLLLGGITATHSATNYLGDTGRDFGNYVYSRGEQAILFRAYYAPATRANLSPSESWEEISDDEVKKARTEFVIRPAWTTHTNSPWPWGLKLDEDGDVTIRGRLNAGHGASFGLNDSAYYPGTYHNSNTTEVGLPGWTAGGRRSTRITFWGTPNYNDNTANSILFLPYGVSKDPAVTGGTYIENALSFDTVYKIGIENGAASYCAAWEANAGNFNHGFFFVGFSASGPESLAGLSTFRDFNGAKRSPGIGLFYSHGAKHADLRIVGDNGYVPELYLAHGGVGNNVLGRVILSNTQYGFDYGANPGVLIQHYGNITTEAAYYDPEAGMAADWGMTWSVLPTGTAASKTWLTVGTRASNTSQIAVHLNAGRVSLRSPSMIIIDSSVVLVNFGPTNEAGSSGFWVLSPHQNLGGGEWTVKITPWNGAAS